MANTDKYRTNVSEAARALGLRSAKVRRAKWGEEEFRKRMKKFGRLGGRGHKKGSEHYNEQMALIEHFRQIARKLGRKGGRSPKARVKAERHS
jgi:hypothetical protein